MERNTQYKRGDAGYRACSPRFVFSGRSCSDISKPYRCEKTGACAEAVPAFCHCQRCGDIRT